MGWYPIRIQITHSSLRTFCFCFQKPHILDHPENLRIAEFVAAAAFWATANLQSRKLRFQRKKYSEH